MNELTFGFLYKSKPVDMIDNEYVYFHAYKEMNYPDDSWESVDIGLHHCDQTSHLANIHTQSVIQGWFGKLHCPNQLEGDLKYFECSWATGKPPFKRVFIDIKSCSDEHLKKIGSSKKCKSRDE